MELSGQILSDITVHMKYARYLKDKKRRENWQEICDRNMAMHIKKFPELEKEIEEVYQDFVVPKKVLPSLRSAQFAGKPIDVNPARLYNCSSVAITCPEAFAELMFLLLSGCGVGYSVQKQHIEQLPVLQGPIKPHGKKRKKRYLISDDIAGWANAVKVLLKSYFNGTKELDFDFSDIRDKNTRLVTSGGKAPGPEPLRICLINIVAILENALQERSRGTKLTSIEVHDICCHIADAVLAGGVRRSAMISLFSLEDQDMLYCKSGRWYELNPQRSRANNSAVLVRGRIKKSDFKKFWKILKNSGSGEPGIFFTNDPNNGLTNPCVTGDTKIMVKGKNGHAINRRIDKLVGKEVEVWNGWEWSKTEIKITSTNEPILKVTLKDGRSIKCTYYHNFIIANGNMSRVKALDLRIGDELQEGNLPRVVDSKVKKIEDAGVADVVYCFTEKKRGTGIFNNILTSQCAEICLKDCQFCNLCDIDASTIKDQEDFEARVVAATILGTLQASYTNFHYLREKWQDTCEEEALLGVSLTGQSCKSFQKLDLKRGAKLVVETNKKWAKLLGINSAKRLTTAKPSGTASLVLGTSSGIHSWHARHYLRRLRVNKDEAIYKYLHRRLPKLVEDEIYHPNHTAIITIPQKAPYGAITRDKETAIELLERVKRINLEWIANGHISGANTHNQSVTVSVKPHEWDDVMEWLWVNRETYTGISVLPFDDHTYQQAPFEECTKEQYEELLPYLKSINLESVIEEEDETDLKGELACGGNGGCEI